MSFEKFGILLLIVCLALFFAACGGDDEDGDQVDGDAEAAETPDGDQDSPADGDDGTDGDEVEDDGGLTLCTAQSQTLCFNLDYEGMDGSYVYGLYESWQKGCTNNEGVFKAEFFAADSIQTKFSVELGAFDGARSYDLLNDELQIVWSVEEQVDGEAVTINYFSVNPCEVIVDSEQSAHFDCYLQNFEDEQVNFRVIGAYNCAE